MPRFWLSGPRLFGKTSPRDRLAALWDVSAVDQRMRWVTRIAAPILLADVGDHCFGVFSLDLKSSDERVFGADGDVVRLPIQFRPDGKLHERASSTNIWAGRSSMSALPGRRAELAIKLRYLLARETMIFGSPFGSCAEFVTVAEAVALHFGAGTPT